MTFLLLGQGRRWRARLRVYRLGLDESNFPAGMQLYSARKRKKGRGTELFTFLGGADLPAYSVISDMLEDSPKGRGSL
jgi:hypothetical protein